MRFKHPEPCARSRFIYPVFIPFAGCRERCVFCSQESQTGCRTVAEWELPDFLQTALAPCQSNPPERACELAYYGGTFTALPETVRDECMRQAAALKDSGKISRIRCSTRPDAVTPSLLERLKKQGLDAVELGVQSFCDRPLKASRRNYDGDTAVAACHMVREAGLQLGVQLMPGMPGMTENDFAFDAAAAADIKPEFMRLYPCLVMENTALAELWRRGEFTPWPLEAVLRVLPPALLLFWRNGIRVIRLGLAPQAGLRESILAGPEHPALGQRLRSLALYRLIREEMEGSGLASAARLCAPKRFQGEFYGHGGELKTAWAELGLTPARVEWLDQEYFELS